MTLTFAYQLALGVWPVASPEEAGEAVRVLERHPEMLTNGEACRGFERLQQISIYGDSDE